MGTLLVANRPPQVYPVPYSLRFRASNSAYLTRTPGSTSNRKTWAWSGWVKRGLLASQRTLFFAGATSTTAGAVNIFFDSSDRLNATIYDGGTAGKITSAVFRDPSAFYNILVAVDTTQATGTDRVKIYVNGVQLSAWATDTAPTLNMDTSVNNTTVHYIGCANDSVGTREGFFDGVIAEPRLLDGQTPISSSFGQTNAATGQWVPKAYTGTYGTNGYYLKFADASAATAAAIGKDSSGNGNNWTPSGISVTAGSTFDQLTDTPTNNYATLNPLVPVSRGSLRNANLEYTSGSAATHGSVAGPAIPTTGEWCWEVTACKSVNNEMIGVANIQNNPQLPAAGTEIGNGSRGDYGYRSDGNKYNNGSGGAYGATYTANDIIGVVWNSTAGTLTFYKNGVSQGTAYSSITQVEGKFAPASSNAETGYDIFNFGQRPFAYSYGSAKALNTANIATPAVRKGTDGFVTALDTEANIEATLAAARAGWTDYVEILKNRSASESWAWRFSHDASNEHAVSTTHVYQARSARTMSGSNNWVGYAIRIGAAYGTAASSVSHTNGADTTVTHNLGRTRNMVILFDRSTGNIWVYHPDLTAGKLVKLNSFDAETTVSHIKTVTSNSFKIDTGMATGTYDYLVLGEVEGFIRLWTNSGNSSSDGPFVWTGLSPSLITVRRRGGIGSSWWVADNVRQYSNPADAMVYFDDAAAESFPQGNPIDLNCNGLKYRSSAGTNTSGETNIGFAIGQSFKYATAR